jgi:hypothetical protein
MVMAAAVWVIWAACTKKYAHVKNPFINVLSTGTGFFRSLFSYVDA